MSTIRKNLKRKLYIESNNTKIIKFSTDSSFLLKLKKVIYNSEEKELTAFVFQNAPKFCDKYTPFKYSISEQVCDKICEYVVGSQKFSTLEILKNLLNVEFVITNNHLLNNSGESIIHYFETYHTGNTFAKIYSLLKLLQHFFNNNINTFEILLSYFNKYFEVILTSDEISFCIGVELLILIRLVILKDNDVICNTLCKFYREYTKNRDLNNFNLEEIDSEFIANTISLYKSCILGNAEKCYKLFQELKIWIDLVDAVVRNSKIKFPSNVPVEHNNFLSIYQAFSYIKNDKKMLLQEHSNEVKDSMSKDKYIINKVDWKRTYWVYLQNVDTEHFNPEIADYLYTKASQDSTQILTSKQTYDKQNFLKLCRFKNSNLQPYTEFINTNTDWNIPTDTLIHSNSFYQIICIKNLFYELHKHVIFDDNCSYIFKILNQEQLSELYIKIDEVQFPVLQFLEIYENITKTELLQINIIPELENIVSDYF